MAQVSSIFSQLLGLVPRRLFDASVAKHGGMRHARGFSCWDQFVAMLFCQLGQAHSLREIREGLQACEGKLVHLGMTQAPSHSTLAYANEHRSWQIYQDLFLALVEHLRPQLPGAGGHPLRLPGKLLSLDSTVIDLCVKVFPWARFRATKGAVKLHLLLDHDGLLPHYAVISDGKQADVKVAKTMRFPKGAMLIFDRGYNDYAWFHALTLQGVHFVTRMKEKASYVVVESQSIPDGSRVRADEIIVFTKQAAEDEDRFFRRVVWWDEEGQREFVYLTNHLDLEAATVAAIYKARWQVELFFKSIKQNLRIKTFVGTSANALKIQIWTALIALLLVRFLELRSRLKWHTSRFIALLRRQLFVYRDLFRFLDYPFEGPLTLREDYIPDQPPLFLPSDSSTEGQPHLTKQEKLRQKRIIMRVPNPAPT
jgi:hypothetical protein